MEIITQPKLLTAVFLRKMRQITKRLPALCTICHEYHRTASILCEHCINLITAIRNPCSKCALPLTATDYKVCGHCIKTPPFFNEALIPYYFIEPLRSILHSFKYHDGLFLANFLSNLIINHVNTENLPECLIPVPIHNKRIRLRGYNQSVILTKMLSRHLNIPYTLNLCKKIRNTKPQASLSRDERSINLNNSFHSLPIPYNDVAIIDDIFTTGSTANELAKVVKAQGVQNVRIWCVSRAI